jgi:hypothetical protein
LAYHDIIINPVGYLYTFGVMVVGSGSFFSVLVRLAAVYRKSVKLVIIVVGINDTFSLFLYLVFGTNGNDCIVYGVYKSWHAMCNHICAVSGRDIFKV